MESLKSMESNGTQVKEDEMVVMNHKKKFLMFCEVVLQHERELLSETLNSSQESVNENRAPDLQNNDSIENSTFNSDSDGGPNGEMASYGGGGEDGDSFNSVTCFCGKPFAGRPMIECSGCLTWLHMSCAKVKRKNIPEFYYCDNCKGRGRGLLSSPGVTTASSGEETLHYGTALGSNGEMLIAKPRKPKIKSSSSSDNTKSNSSDSKKPLSSSSLSINGKIKKIRQKMNTSSSPKKSSSVTKAYASSSLAAAASLTELSLNHQIESSSSLPSSLMKPSSIAINNNNIYIETQQQQSSIDSSSDIGGQDSPDKYNNKRAKLL